MKIINLKAFFLMLFSITIFSISCKKKTTDVVNTLEEAIQARVQSDDATMLQGETQNVDDEVNNATSTSERFCGIGNIYNVPFNLYDAIIDLPTTNSGKLTITYNGVVNSGDCKKRTGVITVELVKGVRWVDIGAILKYTFINFKVENICSNQSIKVNGERYITNVNGGNLFRLKNSAVTSLKHKVRTGLNGLDITFTDSSNISRTAVWNVARISTIEFDSARNKYNFNSAGDTIINGKINTESWGTTRYGNPYITVFSIPVKANTFCKLWRPTSGEISHYVGNTTVTVKYGLNALGSPVGQNDCAGFFKVNWVLSNGISGSQPLAQYRF